MEKQQGALEETLMSKRMTPGALEAAGGPSSSKQRFKLVLGLVAVMGLLIVVLVTAFIYRYPQCKVIASFNQTQDAPPARNPGTFTTNCTWKESDSKYEIFTANETAKYLVYGWVKLPEVTHLPLTLIHSGTYETREEKMTADQTQTIFFVFKEMQMINGMKLSLSVPAKLKSFKACRFHVHKIDV